MPTKYKDLFDRAGARFDPVEEKTRPGKGGSKALVYITPRTAMNRLDEVFGPENWSSSYEIHDQIIVATIAVRLEGGETIQHSNVSAIDAPWKGFEDYSVRVEAAASTAFKRAAVSFGVGRYLYQDGVPYLEDESGVTPHPSWDAAPTKSAGDELHAMVCEKPVAHASEPSKQPWKPVFQQGPAGEWIRRLHTFCAKVNEAWAKEHPEFRGDLAIASDIDMQARIAIAEHTGFASAPHLVPMDNYVDSGSYVARKVVKRLKDDYLGRPA